MNAMITKAGPECRRLSSSISRMPIPVYSETAIATVITLVTT